MKRILEPVTYILAAIYFLVDAVFMAVTRPIARWIGQHFEFRRLRGWIKSLPPYPSLALFSVPVKFAKVKAWLQATEAWRAVRALSLAARGTVVRVRARLIGSFNKLATSRD